jgi:hypothetical protein
MLAEVTHSFASCMLGPALAAISLTLVGRAGLGQRLGRNACFASLGNGIAAATLGACGAYVSSRAVFWLTAALMLPGLLALRVIRRAEMLPRHAMDSTSASASTSVFRDVLALLTSRHVLAFAACVALFHLSNAALLPLVGSELTRAVGGTANLLIAACIVLPQAVVALISPWVGRAADRTGSRLVLTLGFAALPIRALLLAAVIDDPVLLVPVQALDGLSAAVMGVAPARDGRPYVGDGAVQPLHGCAWPGRGWRRNAEHAHRRPDRRPARREGRVPSVGGLRRDGGGWRANRTGA